MHHTIKLLSCAFVALSLFVTGCEVFDSDSGSSGGGSGDFSSFQWVYGGFNGSNAQETSATISNLKMQGGGLSYKWAGDTLRSWGISDGDCNGALICLFVQNNKGQWVGGKFDWISTSRTTRDLENVFHHYLGWNLSDVPNPCKAAMVIVSIDGKKRTNVITTTWQR